MSFYMCLIARIFMYNSECVSAYLYSVCVYMFVLIYFRWHWHFMHLFVDTHTLRTPSYVCANAFEDICMIMYVFISNMYRYV